MNLSDPSTYAKAYSQHYRSVCAAAFRITQNATQAQDVAQDVFLRVWRNPEKFDAKRGELGSYLRLMARSRALDLWREGQAAGRAIDRLTAVVEHAPPSEAYRPDEQSDRQATREAVRDAIEQLPLAQREAVFLTYWGGLTADEVARSVGVPLGTAKSRVRLGLTKLRDGVEPDSALAFS